MPLIKRKMVISWPYLTPDKLSVLASCKFYKGFIQILR